MSAASGGPFAGPVRHVYVHVPFCRARCDYCAFTSWALEMGVGGRPAPAAARRLDEYVDGVAAEWERERAAHDVRRLRTLYLGGGTPSLLGPERLERLLEVFRPDLTPRAEITVETNPEDVDAAYGAWAAGSGHGQTPSPQVRVSLGVQSFSAELRAALGRTAQADPAAAFQRLRAAGVTNLGIDLISGIPGQTAASLGGDIAAVLDLRPDHVSWYELDVVEGTPLAARMAARAVARPGAVTRGRPAAPASAAAGFAGPAGDDAGLAGPARDYAGADEAADDARAAQFRRVVGELSRTGYDWYEVSNFARPGKKARHNLAYWRARPYLGLGPGAVSTVGRRRWTNIADPGAWATALLGRHVVPRSHEALDAATAARERFLLAARCGETVPLAEVSEVIDADAARRLAAAGLVSLHSGTIRVTRKGRHVADAICVRLFRASRLRG